MHSDFLNWPLILTEILLFVKKVYRRLQNLLFLKTLRHRYYLVATTDTIFENICSFRRRTIFSGFFQERLHAFTELITISQEDMSVVSNTDVLFSYWKVSFVHWTDTDFPGALICLLNRNRFSRSPFWLPKTSLFSRSTYFSYQIDTYSPGSLFLNIN